MRGKEKDRGVRGRKIDRKGVRKGERERERGKEKERGVRGRKRDRKGVRKG